MRVTIRKPNGERLTITGTPEEVAALLKAREEQPAPLQAPVYIPYFRPTPWRWWDGAPVEPYITWGSSDLTLHDGHTLDVNLSATTVTRGGS